MAPKPKAISSLGETGAAAALARLETEEFKCYQSKERLESELLALVQPSPNAPDDVKALFNNEKLKLEADLLFAFKRWDAARKSLLEYDKSVAVEKREGEKVPVSEAREVVAQLLLSISLAVEQCIITDAQSSALCDSPEAFHLQHAENYRAAVAGAIQAAQSEGVLPAWAVSQ